MPKIVDRDAMRLRILEAAQGVFARDGVHAARMDAVAKAAGLAKGTLYLYFPSKEALTAALVRAHFAAAEARIAELPVATTPDGLRDGLAAALANAEEQAAALKLFLAVFRPEFSEPGVQREVTGFFDRIAADLARRLSAAGLASEDEAPARARSLVAMIDGVLLHVAVFPSAFADPPALVEEFLDLVARRFSAAR